jgi:nitrogen fixation protein FixH
MIGVDKTTASEGTSANGAKITGWHVLLGLVAFFAITSAVNGLMIYKAVTTFGGLSTPDAYRQGLAYNRRIAASAQQNERGWTDTIEVVRQPPTVRVRLSDREGAAIKGLALSAQFGRPATNRYDFKVRLRESHSGDYVADIPAIGAGNWVVDVIANAGDSEGASKVYRARRRLWIKR